ncbi:MAG: hypothetical protein K0R29_2053 [Pseudobdellovibrio sp.]|jgi:hypothetical protein|nr:hypothetical protein [Pseudobdellovibrio sp.]
MRIKGIFLSIFICLAVADAEPLRSRVFTSGPNAGKKLTDVLTSYTARNHDGEVIRIPPKSITDALAFFDSHSATNRRYEQMVLTADPENPGKSVFMTQLESNQGPTIENQKYIVIFDLNSKASSKRLHIINTETGEVDSVEASHGRDTDCGGDRLGWACRFISDRESEGTPLGFFTTGEMFNGNHGGSLRMNGLEGSFRQCRRNSKGIYETCPGNILPTTIIIHSASYVMEGHAGRSHGCVAVSEPNMARFREKLRDGALFYFYHNSLDTQVRQPVSGLITESQSDDD